LTVENQNRKRKAVEQDNFHPDSHPKPDRAGMPTVRKDRLRLIPYHAGSNEKSYQRKIPLHSNRADRNTFQIGVGGHRGRKIGCAGQF
jgi:hypothetical protein